MKYSREQKVDYITNFLFHFGKALWKSIPLVGPFVEELFYEQFKEKLRLSASTQTDQKLDLILSAIPNVDVAHLDAMLTSASDEMKGILTHKFSTILQAVQEGSLNTEKLLADIKENTAGIPSILDFMRILEESMLDRNTLEMALSEIERKRSAWIHRISDNQRKLLTIIPLENAIDLDELWLDVQTILPASGYKEFRFRLHELEWLGLVERYRANDKWHYKKTAYGCEVSPISS